VLSPKTVEHHVSAIFRKLGVRSRDEARHAAIRRGLIPKSLGATT
jgi:DNA-binding NarL/FixJ family response regulator